MNSPDIFGNELLPRVGNAPQKGIDFRDMDYIECNRRFLENNDWQQVENEFSATQPETHKIKSFEPERLALVAELEHCREQKNTLGEEYALAAQNQEQEEKNWRTINEFKQNLLSVLPAKYLESAQNFFNDFIRGDEDGSLMPWEKDTAFNLTASAQKFLFFPKLNRFKNEFMAQKSRFFALKPRFSLSDDWTEVKSEMADFYNLAGLQKQLADLDTAILRIERHQQEIAAIIGNERVSLAQKVTRLKSYWDKKLFMPENDGNIAFSPEKEHQLQNFENISRTWAMIMNIAKHYEIHFAETLGLVEQNKPVAAVYECEHNRILCNKSFLIDEQIATIAQILLNRLQPPLAVAVDVKTLYQFELCRQAEIVAQMVNLASETTFFWSILLKKWQSEYQAEFKTYSANTVTNNAYGKVFVTALNNQKVRRIAEDNVCKILDKPQTDSPTKSVNLSMGEIISPFVMRGAPLINGDYNLKPALEKIPLESKMRIQQFANTHQDYSLLDMGELKLS